MNRLPYRLLSLLLVLLGVLVLVSGKLPIPGMAAMRGGAGQALGLAVAVIGLLMLRTTGRK